MLHFFYSKPRSHSLFFSPFSRARESERSLPSFRFFLDTCFQPPPGSLSLSRSREKVKTLGTRFTIKETVHSVTDYLIYSFFSRLPMIQVFFRGKLSHFISRHRSLELRFKLKACLFSRPGSSRFGLDESLSSRDISVMTSFCSM